MRLRNSLSTGIGITIATFLTVAILFSSGCGGVRAQLSLNIAPSPTPSAYPYGTYYSTISGTFEGWTGDTIFQLDNGQIWKQSSYAYLYHYAYRPNVILIPDGFYWKMKVDDVNELVTVERIQ